MPTGEIACFSAAAAGVISTLAGVIAWGAVKLYAIQDKRVEIATGSANFWRDMYLSSISVGERSQSTAQRVIEAAAGRRGAI